MPVTGRLAATLDSYIAAAHPCPEPGHKLFHTGDPSRPADKSTVYNRFRRYLADADIPHFPGGPHIHSLRHGFAVANLRRWAADGADLVVMLPYLSAYMGHADLRGTQYYLQLTADAHPEVAAMASARFGYVIPGPADAARSPAVSRAGPAGGDLAGRWLSRFLTSHLAAERDVSPRPSRPTGTRSGCCSPGSATCRQSRPRNCASPTSTGRGCWRSWTGCKLSAATRRQPATSAWPLIRSFARYTAIERPEFLGQATQIIAVKQKKTPAADMGHLSGDEVKALLAEPDPATRRGQRDTVLLSALYDTAARVQEICDLNTCRRPRRPPDGGDAARQRFQDQAGPGDGPHSPADPGLPQPPRAPPRRRQRRRPAVQRARNIPA